MHDRNTLGVWMSPGKHGRIIREKYFKTWASPVLILISCGHDPLLFLSSGNEVSYSSRYEFAHAGGHRGIPFDTLKSEPIRPAGCSCPARRLC